MGGGFTRLIRGSRSQGDACPPPSLAGACWHLGHPLRSRIRARFEYLKKLGREGPFSLEQVLAPDEPGALLRRGGGRIEILERGENGVWEAGRGP